MTVTKDALPDGLQDYQAAASVQAVQVEESTPVQTSGALVVAEPGDWIAVGADGYPYVVAGADFARTYDTGAAIGEGAEPEGSAGELPLPDLTDAGETPGA